MGRLVSLPMYDAGAEAQAAFRAVLRDALRREGLDGVCDGLGQPDDLVTHWLRPDLLLSQTCGYPFATVLRGRVQLVGTPCYAAPGCRGPLYRSFVVVRKDRPTDRLSDLRGSRAAINGIGSQSGWNALRALVAPLAGGKRFFADVLTSGSHHESMRLVGTGEVDVAAIDCVTFALAGRRRPELTAPLRVVAESAEAPGLPLITSIRTTSRDLARLRAALTRACAHPGARDLLLEGWASLPPETYDDLLRMEADAVSAGYPDLV